MSQNLVWHYFILHRPSEAECILCNKFYHNEHVPNLETHLIREHPEVITEIRENIRRADLGVYFIFDVEDSKARCINNCIVNIFNGIDYLKDHLHSHGINKHARALNNTQRNPYGNASQPTAVEDNGSASTSKQPIDVLSQNTEDHEKLSWSNSNNLVWQYFKPVKYPYANCNICKNRYKSIRYLRNFEQHLLLCHAELIDEIRCEIDEEIRRLNLSPYFVCDTELPRIKCNIGNCNYKINMFHGTKKLKDHLSINHSSTYKRISMPKSNTDIMIKQVAEGSNESIQLIKDNEGVNASKHPTNTLLQKTENIVELPWGNSNNLVWRYFKPVKYPYANCNICKNRYKSIRYLRNFEQHLLLCHAELIDEIRCEIDEEIRRLNLSPYFVCDTELLRIRCNIDNCIHKINIFHETKKLKYHLSIYHSSTYTRIFMPKSNTDIMIEQVVESSNESIQLIKGNKSVTASKHPTDTLLQETGNLVELPWGNSNNLVWRYFKPVRNPYANCNICKNLYKSIRYLGNFEQHLLLCHEELIDEIRCEIDEEIRRLNLSPYFVCDTELPRIRCNIDNCIYKINMFHGTKKLKDHLSIYHSTYTRISMPKSNTDIMIEQVAGGSNESIQLIKDNKNANASKHLTDALLQETENFVELPWGNANNLVWRYFKPVRKPYAKCNICKKYCKGRVLKKFEHHLLDYHIILIAQMRCEIDEEIRYRSLSPYFVCDTGLSRIKCNVDNCIYILNLFNGYMGLIEHLYNHHASIFTAMFQYIPRNTIRIMTKSVAEEDNTFTNVDDPRPGPSWQT
ncbi:uncharacterized protein LOC120359506 [Solenopsis invicta]|uniref:uncharacterized protein LOC120359506 n=1 Tax=Solenopsis invicta TaxID=13686 RepID=UPI00193DDFF8|nr:uncharacterized protein LOC120359506 [Solenopsis invicta]XP_039313112.1 uncharacterized protein LOC120359506 [Solenopsis invicta]XP_039313113.1 uncharacterized protein LOC120359506 [Solenopsis invicta]